jgi:hypothetical protein
VTARPSARRRSIRARIDDADDADSAGALLEALFAEGAVAVELSDEMALRLHWHLAAHGWLMDWRA